MHTAYGHCLFIHLLYLLPYQACCYRTTAIGLYNLAYVGIRCITGHA